MENERLTIGALARRVGLTPRTLRFYDGARLRAGHDERVLPALDADFP